MRRLIILLGVFLVVTIGCGHTTQNVPMLQDQAELIRSNGENLKKGMSIEEVKNLFGPPSIYRVKACDCNECAPLGAVEQKIEAMWYVYKSVKDPNVYIHLVFRHGKLSYGSAETMAGTIFLE